MVIIFSTESIRKTSISKALYETNRLIVARFSVKNIDYRAKNYRGMKSIVNLLTTRRTIASRPHKCNIIIRAQTESLRLYILN